MKPPPLASPLDLQRFVKKLLLRELDAARRALRYAKTVHQPRTLHGLRYAIARVKKLEALIELFDGTPLPKLPVRLKPPPKQLDMIDRLRKRVSARAPRRIPDVP